MIFNTAANYARQVNVAAIAPGIENRVAEIVAAHLQKNSDPLANFPETAKKSFWAAQLKISVKTLDKRITENRIPSDPNLGRTYFRREDIRPLFA